MIFLGVQILNIFLAFLLTRKIASYLVLSQLVILTNLIGCIIREIKIYHSFIGSFYLVLFGIGLNIGALLFNLFVARKRKDFFMQENKLPVNENYNELLVYICSFVFFVICAVFFFVVYGVPIFFKNVNIARVSFQHAVWANFFYRVFLYALPLSSLIFISYWQVYNNKIAKFFAFFSMIFVFIELALLGYKGYVLWYCILLIMILNVYFSNKRIFLVGSILVLIGVLTGIFITSLNYRVDTKKAAIKFLKRATVYNAFGYTVVVYEFPKDKQALKQMRAGETFNVFLARWKFGNNNFLSKTSRALTITIVGTLLVLGGKGWMIFVSLMLGFIYQFIYFVVFEVRNNPLFSSLLLFLTYSIIGVINRGLNFSYFFQPMLSLLILGFCYYILIVFASRLDLVSSIHKA